MRSSTVSTILSVAALSTGSIAAVTMNIARSPGAGRLTRRSLSPRTTITESLQNNVTDGSYMVDVTVGSTGQKLTLVIDTGSSDVWLLDSTADVCTSARIQEEVGEGGCITPYDPTKSTSYKDIMPNGFFIQYGDGSGALGDYITDDFTIGGATIKALEMGLAHNSTLISGLMGIGYDVNEASNDPDGNTAPFTYPSIVDQMVSQGLITTKAYSLYLDDLEASTGSIIFGGIDSDKYSGDLLQLPVIPEEAENGTAIYAALAVAMDSLSITGQAGNITTITDKTELPVVLDSGTTLTYVPAQLANSVYELLNAVDDTENSGYVYVDCNLASTSPKMTLNFGFGGSSNVSVSVPISEMIISLPSVGGGGFGGFGGPELPFSSACALGINSQEEEPYILGDTFLRSAYVVYDLSNNVIAIAQTNFNSTTSSIVEFQAGATAIPNISGVASGVSVTASATAGKPPGGGKTTDGVTVASPTGTNTGASTTASTTATTTTAKSAAVGAVPAFPGSAMLVLGLSGVCMIAGGGWLLF